MIVASGENSSYSIVISPPGVDRIFLHCTGANDTFRAADVQLAALAGARMFHFGYPPLMRSMYADDGAELAALLSSVKAQGLTVSLDLAKPDPASPAGRADWPAILRQALPHTDVFLPSFEEILYMLRPEQYRQLQQEHTTEELLSFTDSGLLCSLATELLDMGAAVVGLKLGDHGLYLRTTANRERLSSMGLCAPIGTTIDSWLDRELLAPCFEVQVVGTTGAGDCTIAGFLGGMLKGLRIEEVLVSAVGVGACNVEHADAVSGVRSWGDVQSRIERRWAQRGVAIPLPQWSFHASFGIWSNDNKHMDRTDAR
jgi:sugar/nucleoside kinase (ribokinase family)